MTVHLLFFIADFASWIIVGIFMGYKFYPKRNKNIYTKMPFLFITTFTSTMGGLFYTVDKGLPESGFALANFLFAITLTFTLLWSFNFSFRKKYSEKVNSIYVSFMKARSQRALRFQYPRVIRFS